MQIRPAKVDEAVYLSDLAFRSKAHWAYPSDFMNKCRNELCVRKSMIEAGQVYLSESHGTIYGFYSLDILSDTDIELNHLFVEPDFIGRGIGKQLIRHACEKAVELGCKKMVIQGDPNAEGFYLSCGVIRFGERESDSIPGRKLPVFEIILNEVDFSYEHD